MRKVLLLLGGLTLLVALIIYLYSTLKPLYVPTKPIGSKPMYVTSGSTKATISVFDEGISQVSHIKITPDGRYMLVATLPGVVWIYHAVDGVFRRQQEPFFTLATSQPGFPPEEAGLTGLAFGADFESSGDIFLTYSFAFEKKSFRNRVTRVTFTKRGKKVIGTQALQIFEANTPGTGSHQIQGGVGVMVEGKPHFLFPIGEGFVADRALDPSKEAGKIMLIARDGGTPAGARPFPESPKVQAIGIRNAPAMAQHPITGKIAIGDTGPSNFDRFLYGTMFDSDGKIHPKTSFHWDGTEGSLQLGALDSFDTNKEMVLHRWTPTETPVNIVFYDSKKLPALEKNAHYVLVDLFGRTGEKINKPGKSIMLGKLFDGKINSLQLMPFIERAPEGEGKFGHPLGLAVNKQTGDIYFGDIMEGTIYKVTLQ
jgi:hypothetical protein